MKSLVPFVGLILVFLLSQTDAKHTKKRGTAVSSQGTDCTQIKALSPHASSGVYVIHPHGVKTPFKVYCEMQADGGWMVFQRRSGGEVSFDRKWAAYKNGFGNLTHDHWLGLQKVFTVTKYKTKSWTMRVDLSDHKGVAAFAEYKNFRLGNGKKGFQLHVGGYTGNAGDAIRGADGDVDQNGYGFSTIDRDNDGCSPCIFGDIAQNKCTMSEGGGWWYSRCGSASLNGNWHPVGDHIGYGNGLHWRTWKSHKMYSVKTSRMMIKSV
ncbi:angiopoietin-related protein 5-like [Hippoglossus stenolepis]|uniref:angiopoietin-related protein 5-like n=1 Tax=Hippoglossus stenolepis TaxID=195615 RepID=UPI00159BFC99|nr:angiopoietin-related protein 5-like [Hippoglossus stenolepis]